jgi:hypothetical protein
MRFVKYLFHKFQHNHLIRPHKITELYNINSSTITVSQDCRTLLHKLQHNHCVRYLLTEPLYA